MEKETKNILIGAGALAALYILFNKYKKDVINKPIGNNKVVSNEPVPVVPIETAPILPYKPIEVIPIPTPLLPNEQLPIEPTPFEPVPIFTNPIDDFINPIVPFEPVVTLPIEPTPLLVEQLPVEPAPFEPIPIFSNPIDDFILEPLLIQNPVDSFVYSASIETQKEDYTIINKAQSIVNDLNLIDTISNITTKSADDINLLNNTIAKVEVALNDDLVVEFLDNNNVNYDVSNEKAYVEEVIAEKKKVIEVSGMNFIAASSMNDLCNLPFYTGLGSDQEGLINLYVNKDDYNSIAFGNPIGYTLYLDNSLNIPYTDKKYVSRWGTTDKVLELDQNGVIVNILPACEMKRVQVSGINYVTSNSVGDLCNLPLYTGLGNKQEGLINLYLKQDDYNTVVFGNPIGYKLYKDSTLRNIYNDTKYVSRWGGSDRVLELDQNGIIVGILPACEMRAISVGGVDFVVNNDVYNLCQDPYFGGNGNSSQVVRLYIDLANWGRLSGNPIGLKFYKDENLRNPWTDTKYIVRWGNRDLPVLEINQNNGEVINVMSPCYVINVESKKLQQLYEQENMDVIVDYSPQLESPQVINSIHPIDQFILNTPQLGNESYIFFAFESDTACKQNGWGTFINLKYGATDLCNSNVIYGDFKSYGNIFPNNTIYAKENGTDSIRRYSISSDGQSASAIDDCSSCPKIIVHPQTQQDTYLFFGFDSNTACEQNGWGIPIKLQIGAKDLCNSDIIYGDFKSYGNIFPNNTIYGKENGTDSIRRYLISSDGQYATAIDICKNC